MSWIPNGKEIAGVLALDGPSRYKHWIKKVADEEHLWGLWLNGWAVMADENGHELVPVWPHSKYAALCAKNAWAGYQPKSIPLDAWLDRWTPGAERDGWLVAVFPTPDG